MRAAVLNKRKSLKTFWSEAAVACVGEAVPQIQHRLLREVREVAQAAADFFLHVVALEEPESERVLVCRGAEEEDGWIVVVQLGEFREFERAPGVEIVPGAASSTAMPLAGAANERFTEFGELAH